MVMLQMAPPLAYQWPQYTNPYAVPATPLDKIGPASPPLPINRPPAVTVIGHVDFQADRALLNKYVPKHYFEVATLIALTLVGIAVMRGALRCVFRTKARITDAEAKFNEHDRHAFEMLTRHAEAIETIRQIEPAAAAEMQANIAADPSIKEVIRAGIAGGTTRLLAPILPAGRDHGWPHVRFHPGNIGCDRSKRLRDGAPSSWLPGLVFLAGWFARGAVRRVLTALRRRGWHR